MLTRRYLAALMDRPGDIVCIDMIRVDLDALRCLPAFQRFEVELADAIRVAARGVAHKLSTGFAQVVPSACAR